MLLHLSDVHVTDPGSAIAAFADGERRLAAVIDHLLDHDVPLDAVVLTGDLVDVGTDDEYERLVAQLHRLPYPWFALPGNHDQRTAFDAALSSTNGWTVPSDGPLNAAVEIDLAAGPNVLLAGIDSTRPGNHDGRWTDETLTWLDETLSAASDRPTLVFTHHPPVDTGLWHMDYGGAHGGAELARIIERHPQVHVVACGHVHRRLVVRWAGTLLSCAPSLTFLTEAVLDEREPFLHDGLPELPLYRFVDGRFMIDSLDWHPGRTRIPMSLALGDGWDAYATAARSGVLPRDATGH